MPIMCILTEIHTILCHLEYQRIQNVTKEIEKMPDCDYKMYEAVKNINRLMSQKPLLIKKDNDLISNQKEQLKLIAKYFKEIFF